MEDAELIYETSGYDEKVNFIEELSINNKLKEYKIQLGIKENKKELVIKATNEDTKEIFYFQKAYTMSEFQKLSKIFSVYERVEDLISFLKDQYKNSKLDIEEKDNDLFIKFKIFLPDGKEKLINLELKKILRGRMHIVKYFFESIKNAKKDISFSENKNRILEDKNKVLEDKTRVLEDEKKN